MGLRLFEKPQRKNREVTRMNANCVLADPELVVFMFTIDKQKNPCAFAGHSSKVYKRDEITTETSS